MSFFSFLFPRFFSWDVLAYDLGFILGIPRFGYWIWSDGFGSRCCGYNKGLTMCMYVYFVLFAISVGCAFGYPLSRTCLLGSWGRTLYLLLLSFWSSALGLERSRRHGIGTEKRHAFLVLKSLGRCLSRLELLLYVMHMYVFWIG